MATGTGSLTAICGLIFSLDAIGLEPVIGLKPMGNMLTKR